MNRIGVTLLLAGLALTRGAAGQTVPDAGAHPRLFCGPGDLPALRARAAQPAGRATLAALDALLERAARYGFGYHAPTAEHSMGNIWATGHALRYVLTGDPAEARRAQELCRHNLFGNYYYGGGWLHAYTLMGLAVSYDLCYDAWDPDFRDMVQVYLIRNAQQLARLPEQEDWIRAVSDYGFANPQDRFAPRSPRDRQAARFQAAAALGALAVLGDPPPLFDPPPLAEVRRIAPDAGYAPWVGVPVVPFEDDRMPELWLINGPFLRGAGGPALDALGGVARARPEPGDTLVSDGRAVDFRHYRPAGQSATNGPRIYARDCGRYWGRGTGGGYLPGIELAEAWKTRLERRPELDILLYTVVTNERERVIQACANRRAGSVGNRLWLAGEALSDGELVRLAQGLYPLLIEVQVVGGYSMQSPRLREYTEAMAAADRAHARRWRERCAARELGAHPVGQMIEALLAGVRGYWRADLGADDAWGWEQTADTMTPLLLACRRVLGRDLAGETPARHVMPLVARVGDACPWMSLDAVLTQSLPFLPAADAQAGDLAAAAWWIERAGGSGVRRPLDAVLALTAHPSLPAPAPPAFPLAGLFASYGVPVFRRAWDGPDPAVVRIESGAGLGTGVEGGNLFIRARGRTWLLPRGGADRAWANHLWLGSLTPTGPARVTHTRFDPDGGGRLVMVMDRFPPPADAPAPRVERAFEVVFPPAEAGAALWILCVDTFTACEGIEKGWRYDLGNVGEIKARLASNETGLQLDRDGWLYHPGKNAREPAAADAWLSVRMLAPRPLRIGPKGHKNDPGIAIECVLDRPETAPQKALRAVGSKGVDDVADRLLEEFDTERTVATRRTAGTEAVVTLLAIHPTSRRPDVRATPTPGGLEVTVDGRAFRFERGPENP